MDSFRHHDSFRIYLHLLVTLLSKPSRNSERSASVAMPGVRQALLMPWSGGVWRSTHLNAHQSQSLTSVPTGVHPAPTFCKAHSTKLIVSVHGLVAQVFRFQVSTVVISTNSIHLDVAITHELLQAS